MKVQPCPGCGREQSVYVEDGTAGSMYYVHCGWCRLGIPPTLAREVEQPGQPHVIKSATFSPAHTLHPSRLLRVRDMNNDLSRTVRFLSIITIIEVIVIFALLAALSMSLAHDAQGAPPPRPRPCSLPRPTIPAFATVKGTRVDRNQRHVLTWVLGEGRRRKVGYAVMVASVIATTQEAEAHELRGGGGSSAGPYQLTSEHGSYEQRVTVEYSGNWFLNGAVEYARRHPHSSPSAIAQGVERSAYPNAYARWIPEARRTIKIYYGRCRV